MSHPSRRTLLQAGAASLLVTPIARAATGRPSILLLFPDQLRGQALSFCGETNVRTPTFDRIAREGVFFDRAYTADPVCAPARASLLSGLFPPSHTVLDNGQRLPVDLPTLPSRLAEAGYHTGYIGKWHLDSNDKPGFVPRPRRHGFSYWAAYNSGHNYRDSQYFLGDDEKPRRPSPADRWEPSYQVDQALEYLQARKKDGKDFFLMMSFGPPHPPGTAPIEDWGRDLPDGALSKVNKASLRLNPNVPDWIHEANTGPKGKGERDPGARHHLQGYYASVLALDAEIGRLLDGLTDLGLRSRTLTVLASDHGELGGAHGQYKKGEPFEEAIRIPVAFSWPGELEPRRLDAPISSTDIAPTLLGLAGAGRLREAHGLDLSSTLRTGATPDRPNVLICGQLGKDDRWFGLRGPRFTYAETGKEKVPTLYDNTEDPWQMTNVAARPQHAEVVARLSKALREERQKVRGAED